MFRLRNMQDGLERPRTDLLATLGQAVIDILVTTVAFLAAFLARSVFTPLEFQNALGFILLYAFATPLILYVAGVYRQIWPLTSGYGAEIIANGFVFSTALFSVFDVLFPIHPLPLGILWLGSILAFGGIVFTRYRSRLIRRALRLGNSNRAPVARDSCGVTRVLIVGANEAGQNLVWRLKHRLLHAESDFFVVGFVDNDTRKQGRYVEEVPILGRYADLPHVVDANHVDLAIIAHRVDTPEGREALAYCERSKARIKLLPDMVSYLNTKQGTALLRKVESRDLIGRGSVSQPGGAPLDLLTGRIVLVTGAAGSIGSELCRQLAGFPIGALILLDNNESGLHDLHIELAAKFPKSTLVPLLADITIHRTMRTAFLEYRPEIVFHAAAYKHVPMLERYPNEALRVNIGGTRNLAELAQQFGVERFVLISTDKAVHPSCVMGATKRACELMLRALSQQLRNRTLFTTVRFGNVLGSRGSVLPTFNQQIDAGGPVTITDRRMKRFFMSIPEAVNLVIHASSLTTSNSNDVFLLRMGEAVPIVDLAERVIRLHGLRPYIDIPIEFTGIRLGEKLVEELNTANEEIHDTAHPGVICLSDKQPYFDGKLFLEYVDRTLQTYFDDSSTVIAQLAHAETNAVLAPHEPNAAGVSLPAQPQWQGANVQTGQPQRSVGRYRQGPFLQLDSGNSPSTSSVPSS